MARLLALLLLPFCAAPAQHGSAQAVLWVRTSAEYDAAARQAYAAARRSLERALENRYWTAALEQTGPFFDLPPAVILDLDETVLDNTEFQARLAREGKAYSEEAWSAWVAERRAGLIPGALDFLTAARASGVALFYVSNRTCRDDDPEDATARLLRTLNVPLEPGRLLCRGDSGEKGARRAAVARTHRILLLIGDDLNDFISAPPDLAGRDALAQAYAQFWGERWIVLPNPMYGSWERAIPSMTEALK
ncbi:MAG: 5'-nucleotidase, lipoprotein e(P4) family [bacterium]|jgi:5'-nucleotidase (lipoprotein e(P4) family)